MPIAMPVTQKPTSPPRRETKRPARSAGPAPAEKAGPAERRREPPTTGRAAVTYEKLMLAAGELLGEVGFEKLTTNGICARASMTPPALYHYFNDKYEILEELARRLLKRQSDAFAIWLFQGGWQSAADRSQRLEEWYHIAAKIVAEEPGGVWTMRALRALPSLAPVRLESQRTFTDQLFAFYRQIMPNVPPDILWYRLRIRAEFGYSVDELAIEEDRIPRDILFREAARIVASAFADEEEALSAKV